MRILLVSLIAILTASVAVADSGEGTKELLAQADMIAAKVSKQRGLALKKPIKRGVMNTKQLEARLLKRIAEQYTPAEIAGESLSMKRFGLLEPTADYLKVVTNLLTSQIAGFYDPFEGELFLSEENSMGGEMLLAHEIDHALQDQHFDLARFMTEEKANADASSARQALIEGDGVALMMEYLLAGMGKSAPWAENGFAEQAASMTASQASSIKGAPFALRESLIFPYSDGLRFVAHFRKVHDWSRIDKIYGKPPLSTEHILHPELYEAYQPPVVITATLPAGVLDYAVAYSNVVGEKGLAILLEAHGVDRAKANAAAAGWGGDRAVVYTPPNHSGAVAGSVGVLRSRWDQEIDAIEFYNALSHALPSLSSGGQLLADGREPTDSSGDYLRYRNGNGAVVTAARKGSDVVLLVGAPPAREPDIRRAAFAWAAK